MATHPHSANQTAGSTGDKKARTDGNGSWSNGAIGNIGSPFKPLFENTGIMTMAVMPNTVVQCVCGSWIHCDDNAESFTAGCCGASLNREDFAELLPCSCHNLQVCSSKSTWSFRFPADPGRTHAPRFACRVTAILPKSCQACRILAFLRSSDSNPAVFSEMEGH